MIDIVHVAASAVSDFFSSLDSNQITALATAVSALFAGTIFLINWRQLRHTRNVERAYISGGGPLDANDLNKFLFTVNNYGKTPGILTEYAVEFCSLTDIRSVPTYGKRGYKRKAFHDRIPPGGIKETRVVAWIDVPPLTRPLLVYGRYWYEDIWKKGHTSGFVLVVHANGTDGHVTGDIPRDLLELGGHSLNLPRALFHCERSFPRPVVIAEHQVVRSLVGMNTRTAPIPLRPDVGALTTPTLPRLLCHDRQRAPCPRPDDQARRLRERVWPHDREIEVVLRAAVAPTKTNALAGRPYRQGHRGGLVEAPAISGTVVSIACSGWPPSAKLFRTAQSWSLRGSGDCASCVFCRRSSKTCSI